MELEESQHEQGVKWSPVSMDTLDPMLPSVMVSTNAGPATDQMVRH